MKKLLFSLAFLAAGISGFAQHRSDTETEGQTSFYAELGGPGILFSANIDRRFATSRLGWGGRIGLGFVSGDLEYDPVTGYNYQRSVLTIPLQVNYIFGKGNSPHTFEAGAGLTIAGRKLDLLNSYYNSRGSLVFGTASFMYRRQPVNGGFSWRIGFTPIIASGYIQPSGAVSVGYNF